MEVLEHTSWHSYPSVYAIGHRAVSELFFDSVLVEEKVDGSQFSFGVFGGEVKCRSKGQQIVVDAPEKMFARAVAVVLDKAPLLKDGWTYRGEYLQSPKHNALAYGRIPKDHIILFDINDGHEQYLTPEEKAVEAERIGLEVVPVIHVGRIGGAAELLALLDRDSVLGGVKVEGVVAKNYARFGIDKKVLMGKYVSEAFKEVHNKEWRKSNPQGRDILQTLIDGLKTEARWQKGVQHVRERGELTDSPKDIGVLLREICVDVQKECEGDIRDALFRWAWPQINRGVIAGFPEWYKERLLNSAFENTEAPQASEIQFLDKPEAVLPK